MKKIFVSIILLVSAIFLSGCFNSVQEEKIDEYSIVSVMKSVDEGIEWKSGSESEKETISISPDVLNIKISPFNDQVVYVGTDRNGLFKSEDSGNTWKILDFPLSKIYGLALGKDQGTVYASGVLNKRGKIYKSLDGGKEWNEIYTEPSDGTFVSYLEVSNNNPEILYAATNSGTVIKTVDGGNSWKNLDKANGPIINISFDSSNDNVAYFSIFNKDILRTRDGGETFESLGKGIKDAKSNSKIFFLTTDINIAGALYVGVDGEILRSFNYGNTFERLNIIESARAFPIRSVAVNPKNSNEIIFSAGGVVYKSVDNGKQWSVSQLNVEKPIYKIEYNSMNPGVVYLGLREIK